MYKIIKKCRLARMKKTDIRDENAHDNIRYSYIIIFAFLDFVVNNNRLQP